ncbi:MAG TPA: hypothetical protein VKE22_01505 [Haliangiales bacterium]|nr:hypothetical protein [Haliangiales bacterium]
MTLDLTQLARALGGMSAEGRVAARVDGVDLEIDVERDWLGRPRWTRLRAEAPDARGMEISFSREVLADFIESLAEPDPRERRRRAYEHLGMSVAEPFSVLTRFQSAARWLGQASAYHVAIRAGWVTAVRAAADADLLGTVVAAHAVAALAAGGDAMYDSWLALARAMGGRVEEPRSGVYSVSGVYAGAAVIVDLGPPLHGVRVAAERRWRGKAYRLVSAAAAPLVQSAPAEGFADRVDRLPPGWAHAFHELGAVVIDADEDRATISLVEARPEVDRIQAAVAVLAPLLDAEGNAPYR